MAKIIHLSDFHLGRNLHLEKARLNLLAQFLSKENVSHIVYTGDIIDSPSVLEKVKNRIFVEYSEVREMANAKKEKPFTETILSMGESYIDLYNKTLKETMDEEMDEAARNVTNFIHLIGSISPNNVVFCCGNHDRMRPLSTETAQRFCKKNNDTGDVFSCYDRFCQKIGLGYNHETYYHDKSGINFIILNTNWGAPVNGESNNMCIDCEGIEHILDDIERNGRDSRNENIVVAHKPFDDQCEEAKYGYSASISIVEKLEEMACAFLYGDKHSSEVHTKDSMKKYMAGAPLSGKRIYYNLMEYDRENGITKCDFVSLNDDEWIKIPVHDCIDQVYRQSEPYIKELSFNYLCDNGQRSKQWFSVLQQMTDSINTGRFDQISNLFSACCRIYDGLGRVPISDNVFKMIKDRLFASSHFRTVSIKGDPGVGKSTFLGIVFIYLLNELYHGRINAIPFYVNLDNILTDERISEDINRQERDVKGIVNIICGVLQNNIKECLALAKQYGLPPCFLIDGLDKSNLLIYSSETIEQGLQRVIETASTIEESRCLMCFNTFSSIPSLQDSFHQVNKFDTVLFLNKVDVVPYKAKEERHIRMIRAFMQLKGKTADDESVKLVCKKISKYQRISIDLNFLHTNSDRLLSGSDPDDPWIVMKRYKNRLRDEIDRLFDERNIKEVERATYLIYIKGKCFQEVLQDQRAYALLTFRDYCVIKNRTDVAVYLIACYFVNQLIQYSIDSSAIPKDSVLRCFLTRELGIMVRLIIEDSNQKVISNFFEKHKMEMNGNLYSNFVYIVGHARKANYIDIIEEMSMSESQNDNDFKALYERRSFELASIACRRDGKLVHSFIKSLIQDEEYRQFNSACLLCYYGDINIDSFDEKAEMDIRRRRRKDFDFHNTFLGLVAKVRFCFNFNQPYSMLEADLFTLCDITYRRIQDGSLAGKRSSELLFYGAKYNRRGDSLSDNILNTVIELLEQYNQWRTAHEFEFDIVERSITEAYFDLMLKRLSDVKREHIEHRDMDVEEPYESIAKDFLQITSLKKMKRVGWHITHDKNVPEDEHQRIIGDDVPMKESIMEHVMECVYIAQMFLPEQAPYEYIEQGYNKSKIISMLLMSELGRTQTNDYAPQYSEDFYKILRSKERAELKNIIMLGAMDGYATHSDMYVFFQGKQNRSTDLNYRICREIQTIQTEYKYYTLLDELEFDPKRKRAFMDDLRNVETPMCRAIRRRLIKENPAFTKHFEHP